MKIGITINNDKCDYCMECVDHCRGDALTEYEGEILIDNSECQLCESCLNFCEAMTLTLRNGITVKSRVV